MKYLIILMVTMLIFSCNSTDNKNIVPNDFLNPNCVVIVEDCEYFVVYAYWSFTFVHKGNCKNPIHIYNKVKTNIVVTEE